MVNKLNLALLGDFLSPRSFLKDGGTGPKIVKITAACIKNGSKYR
jgi:hypothetical protein